MEAQRVGALGFPIPSDDHRGGRRGSPGGDAGGDAGGDGGVPELRLLNLWVLLLLSLFLSVGLLPHASATYIGGAFIAAPLETALIGAFKAASGLDVGPYNSTSAEDGIDSFIKGKYLVGVADIPISIAKENLLSFKKFTIPHSSTTFSFVSNLKAGIKLSPDQLVGIYLGKYTKWSQVGVASQLPIVPVARSDAAGLQVRASRFFPGRYKWPYSAVGEGPFPAVYGKNTIQVKGNVNMGNTVKGTPGAIGYLQTGIAVIAYGLNEVAILNKAGNFLTVNGGGSVLGSLPRVPPAPGNSWSAVDLVFQAGDKNYPMVALIYAFMRKSYLGVRGGAAMKKWAEFALSPNGQNLAATYYFFSLPANFIKPIQKAVASISV